MATFPAKIGWNRPRKSENKKLSFRYFLTQRVIKNSKKIAKKFKKLKNTIMASFQAKTGRKTQRNGEYKNYRSFRSYPTRIRKYQKNGKKNSKIPLWHHFKPK